MSSLNFLISFYNQAARRKTIDKTSIFFVSQARADATDNRRKRKEDKGFTAISITLMKNYDGGVFSTLAYLVLKIKKTKKKRVYILQLSFCHFFLYILTLIAGLMLYLRVLKQCQKNF